MSENRAVPKPITYDWRQTGKQLETRGTFRSFSGRQYGKRVVTIGEDLELSEHHSGTEEKIELLSSQLSCLSEVRGHDLNCRWFYCPIVLVDGCV